MITFKSLRWKNFLSTGNQWSEVDLTKHKTTLVVGHNGAGKSTMIKALVRELPATGDGVLWKHPNVRISYVA